MFQKINFLISGSFGKYMNNNIGKNLRDKKFVDFITVFEDSLVSFADKKSKQQACVIRSTSAIILKPDRNTYHETNNN